MRYTPTHINACRILVCQSGFSGCFVRSFKRVSAVLTSAELCNAIALVVPRLRAARAWFTLTYCCFRAAACAANLFLVHWAMVGRHAWSLCANTLSLYSRQRQACGNFMSLGVSKSNAGNTIAMNYLEITENFDKGNFTCLILMA